MSETVVEKIFIVNCKNCGATLRAKAGAALYRCPACRKLFTIPAQYQTAEEEQSPDVVDERAADENEVLTDKNAEEQTAETLTEESPEPEENL